MAGQGSERREILRAMALAVAASQFPGFRRWVFAHDHAKVAGEVVALTTGPYVPQFFETGEYAMVARLAELIIPSDGSPGAREAGVSEFIDFMVASDPGVQFRFRYGLAWLDARARRVDGRPFLDLAEARQTETLKRLPDTGRLRAGDEGGRGVFMLLRPDH